MKVLLINHYPMDKALELWKKGLYPSHHLWGKVEFDRTGEVNMTILKHEKYKFLNAIGKFFKIQHLDQQIRTIILRRKFDIIYAPYASTNTKLLILLKTLKLISTPIVIVVHQPIFGYNSNSKIKRFFAKKFIEQYDSVIFLSKTLKKDMIETLKIPASIHTKKFFYANWGADVNFYNKLPAPQFYEERSYAISAGKTDRDFETLIEAFRNLNFQLKIFCSPESMPVTKDIPENVTINSSGISYLDLLEQYNGARIILIPLKVHKGGTQGLTSLLDALAMGKPVVITTNNMISLDIEKVGIGHWAEQNNSLDWEKILTKMITNKELLQVMGMNAKRLYKEKYNAEVFADELKNIFKKVLQKAE